MGSLVHVEVSKCMRSFQKQKSSSSQRLGGDVCSDTSRKRVISGHIESSQVGTVWQVHHCGRVALNCSYCACSTVYRPRLSLLEKGPEKLD